MAASLCSACLRSSTVQAPVCLLDQWQRGTSLQSARAVSRQPRRRCSWRSASTQLGLAATAPVAPAAAAADLRSSTQQLLEAGSQQLQSLQLPAADGLQLPAEIDAGQVAASAAEALGTAAQGLASAAQRAVAPLDVFSGNLLLDLFFWASLLLIAYSVVVLGPRQ